MSTIQQASSGSFNLAAQRPAPVAPSPSGTGTEVRHPRAEARTQPSPSSTKVAQAAAVAAQEGSKLIAKHSADAAEIAARGEQMRAEVEQAVSSLQQQASQGQRSLSFSVDAKSERLTVQVRDGRTGEVVREIPAKSFRAAAYSRLLGQSTGLLFDQTT